MPTTTDATINVREGELTAAAARNRVDGIARWEADLGRNARSARSAGRALDGRLWNETPAAQTLVPSGGR